LIYWSVWYSNIGCSVVDTWYILSSSIIVSDLSYVYRLKCLLYDMNLFGKYYKLSFYFLVLYWVITDIPYFLMTVINGIIHTRKCSHAITTDESSLIVLNYSSNMRISFVLFSTLYFIYLFKGIEEQFKKLLKRIFVSMCLDVIIQILLALADNVLTMISYDDGALMWLVIFILYTVSNINLCYSYKDKNETSNRIIKLNSGDKDKNKNKVDESLKISDKKDISNM